jgi:hypothetical protein
MDYLEFLQKAIQELHGLKAHHVRTVPVKERFKGQTVWEGDVEVFDVDGDEKIRRVFAWGYELTKEKPEMQAVTVLSVRPITTPKKAVQAYIASTVKDKGK